MLKICCSSCNKEIISPLLVEYKQTICPHCLKEIPVEDVVVYANGYSYFRTDLVKRISYYKSLLLETAKECDLLGRNPSVSPASKQSRMRFLATLEEMMAGARDRFRIIMPENCSVNFLNNQAKGEGNLVNLSRGGACVEIQDSVRLPMKKSPVVLCFTLPGDAKPLAIKGTVSWSKSDTEELNKQFGVGFLSQEQEASDKIWDFITRFSTKIAC
jgi:PilZ domain